MILIVIDVIIFNLSAYYNLKMDILEVFGKLGTFLYVVAGQ